MTKALAEIARASEELSSKEKFVLAGILLDSAEEATEPAEKIEAAWNVEIQRRIANFRSGRVRGIPLAEVKRKLKRLYAK